MVDLLMIRRKMMFPQEKIYSFGGLAIAPAPLYYNGTTFEIKDSDWNHSSYMDKYGKVAGSYYFSFIDVGQYFDSRGVQFDENSGNIDNANTIYYNGYTNWRLPTQTDLETLITTDNSVRPGSTVNGVDNCHFGQTYVTGVTHGSHNIRGLLLFPDNEVINGSANIMRIDSLSTRGSTLTISLSELNNYIEQGCAFIPYFGYCNKEADVWYYGRSSDSYNTASILSSFSFVDAGNNVNDIIRLEIRQNTAVGIRVRYSGAPNGKTAFGHIVRLVRNI